MANQTIWDDPYYRWQQQLLNGANIANTGWQTALGLMIGTGLGNWLGHQFGNWQQARDENFQNQVNAAATQAAAQNLFGNEFNLGWKPQQNSYQFPPQNVLSNIDYQPQYQSPLLSTNYLQQNLTPQFWRR